MTKPESFGHKTARRIVETRAHRNQHLAKPEVRPGGAPEQEQFMTETVSGQAHSAKPGAKGLAYSRTFSTEGVHPYDEVVWERRDVVQTNWKTGETVFEQRGVEFPDFWSVNASTIVTTKYFRGAVGTDAREWSLKQLIDRVVKTYRKAGAEHGYFATPDDAELFEHELTWMLLHQYFSFNSPVWFNVGTKSPQQVSACQPYDALVSTPDGLTPIGRLVEDGAVGTKVYDAQGLTRIVAVKANGVKDVLRLHTKAVYTLDVTADHLVWRASDHVSGEFVPAGELNVGDQLLHVQPEVGGTDRHTAEIASIEALGAMEVYDIQTESGEYLSGNLRVHNCFILSVDDSMDSILNWYKEEGFIFKGGSGAGLNLSRIRSSKELLSSGGTASGPVSFMRGADASAGTIKSGGATRRAAKMVVLDVDHPDIEEFVQTKAREEHKIRALRDAGFDMDLGGDDIHSVQYQNANNSVRVTDEFMRAVEEGTDFGLRARTTGQVIDTIDARELFAKISQAAWECADPGIQYDDTINDWHTNPETGRITASNPCCFTGDTLVQTEHGPMAFEQLTKAVETGDQVRVLTHVTGQLAFTAVSRAWVAGETRELVDVLTTNGLRLRSTPEHRYLTEGEWVQAHNLKAGQRLVSESGMDVVAEVVVVHLSEPVRVYDLEVPDSHNFVVTSEGKPGVVVHNSEYMSLDNSSCNLASLNLLKFLRDDDTFDGELFAKAVETIITAMDISICFADFPTEAIAETTRDYRQLGIGYANLGALLMAMGLGYDSEGGRAMAAAITSLMTGTSYKRSAELAAVVGPYAGYARNAEAHKRVMRKHQAANDATRTASDADRSVHALATKAWADCIALGTDKGWRNAQTSVLAPTGTISFMLDADTTGIEPDFSLVKFKKLVGGGSMQIVNQTVPRALRKLGYAEETIEAIVEFIAEHGHVVDAPGLRPDHYEVFDCAMGERAIKPMGHVRMMAAVQPFISGAISKTVNVPETATVEEIADVYMQGWKLGLKALAVYRDNCKVGQPLSDAKAAGAPVDVSTIAEEAVRIIERPIRKRLPKSRPSQTTSFTVGGAEGYMTAGSYPDDGLGEVFLKLGKQGSTLAGVMDAFSMAISISLQYGVPLETYVAKFTNMKFEPAGLTDDPDIRMAQSIVDYIFRRLALDYLPFEKRAALGIYSAEERKRQLETGSYEAAVEADVAEVSEVESLKARPAVQTSASDVAEEPVVQATAKPAPAEAHTSAELLEVITGSSVDAPLCLTCGTKMRPAGSCFVCEGCGSTSGCS
jgi:ribonucleotide reductase alpha subunit